MSVGEYRQGLASTGFTDVQVELTHEVADGMHSAIIRATKPATAAASLVSGTPGQSCCAP